MVLFPVQERRLRWFLHCLFLPIVFILAISPTLVLNTIQFHSPFRTGYHFWIGNWPTAPPRFSLRYVPNNAALLWREFALRPQQFSAANTFGSGTVFVPAFILLVCVGAFFVRPNRFVICAFLSGLNFFAWTTSLGWGVDMRFYVPILILLVAVAVLPVVWASKNLLVAKRAPAALAIFVLFALACLGFPSRAVGNSPKVGGLEAWKALHFPGSPRQSPWFIAQKHFLQTFGRQPGIILADINPFYLNALWPEGLVAAHLDGETQQVIAFRDIHGYNRAQALAMAKRGLAQSLPVYALFVSKEEMEEKARRLPQVDGYEWVPAENPTAEAAILKLCPRKQ